MIQYDRDLVKSQDSFYENSTKISPDMAQKWIIIKVKYEYLLDNCDEIINPGLKRQLVTICRGLTTIQAKRNKIELQFHVIIELNKFARASLIAKNPTGHNPEMSFRKDDHEIYLRLYDETFYYVVIEKKLKEDGPQEVHYRRQSIVPDRPL